KAKTVSLLIRIPHNPRGKKTDRRTGGLPGTCIPRRPHGWNKAALHPFGGAVANRIAGYTFLNAGGSGALFPNVQRIPDGRVAGASADAWAQAEKLYRPPCPPLHLGDSLAGRAPGGAVFNSSGPGPYRTAIGKQYRAGRRTGDVHLSGR